MRYDNSIIAVMEASEREVIRVGGNAIGTEHVLLGLLVTEGPITAAVQEVEPKLTLASVGVALEQGVDDLPHLQRLGIDPHRILASGALSHPGASSLPARGSHTAEFMRAWQSASAKMGRLEKSKVFSREQKAGSSVLWLAVLEPNARGRHLLEAMGLDADRLRGAVLSALTDPEAPTPAWPLHARPGLLTRLVLRLSTRLHVAS